MTISLKVPYMGMAVGQIAKLAKTTEDALVAQNLASVTTAMPTSGNVTCNLPRGTAVIAVGTNNAIITNSMVDANSIIIASIAQPNADATAIAVRTVAGNGLFTIFTNANTSGNTIVDWVVINGMQGYETTN